MQMIIDDSKKKKTNEYYNKFIALSEKVGNFIVEEKDLSKLRLIINKYIKPKSSQKPSKEIDDSIAGVILSCIENERNTRKNIGICFLLCIISIVVYLLFVIIDTLVTALFSVVNWWIAFIVVIAIVGPISLAIAYLLAKGDY